MLIRSVPWTEQPTDIVSPHPRWMNRGLTAAYLLQPHLWNINLANGRIGGSAVGTGISFVGGKLRTPGTAGNGALLDHGLAVNIAAPISMVVGCEHVSGSADWGLLRNTANWYGWYSDATGAIKTANNNVFNGALTLGGNGSVAFRHTSNADLTGSSGPNIVLDSSTTLPTTVDRTQITLGYSRRNVSDAPAVADFTHFYVFQSALSDAELQELATAPHLLWEDRRIWVPVNAVSASDVLITCTPGNAAADGVTAQIDQARRIDATTGNAAADGVTAKIDQARRIDATPGNAVADGVTAQIDQARVIAATVGNAVADGANAQIITAGAVVIDCTPGNAVADGVTAVIDQARLIAATPGDAVAAGVNAFVSNSSDVVITATPGNAVADGAQALLIQDLIIAAVAANAAAAGVNALILNAVDTDDLYPLEGMTQDYPLQGMTQTYPLAGQTPS